MYVLETGQACLVLIQTNKQTAGLRAPKAPPGSAGSELRVPEAPSVIVPALEKIRLGNLLS